MFQARGLVFQARGQLFQALKHKNVTKTNKIKNTPHHLFFQLSQATRGLLPLHPLAYEEVYITNRFLHY